MWNMVSYIKGGMQAKGIWKQDPEASISPKWGDNEKWRIFYNEELNSLYCLPNIVGVIKFRILRCACHVAKMEEVRDAFKMLTGKSTGKKF